MKRTCNETIELTEEDIVQVLAEHFNTNKESVFLNISSHLEGYGMAEHPVSTVAATIKKEMKS